MLAEQLVQPTIVKDTMENTDEKSDDTEVLAVTDNGELVVSKEQGEGE